MPCARCQRNECDGTCGEAEAPARVQHRRLERSDTLPDIEDEDDDDLFDADDVDDEVTKAAFIDSQARARGANSRIVAIWRSPVSASERVAWPSLRPVSDLEPLF